MDLGGVGGVFVIGLPWLVEAKSVITQQEPPPAREIVTSIDLLIVTPQISIPLRTRSVAPSIPPPGEDVQRWDVRYSGATIPPHPRLLSILQPARFLAVHVDRQEALAALTRGSNAPLGTQPSRAKADAFFDSTGAASGFPGVFGSHWLPGTESAIVLNVDGFRPFDLDVGGPLHQREPQAWAAAIERLRLPGVPVFAILAGADQPRLQRWREWAKTTGGDAVSLRETGRFVLTDAALRIATERRATFADCGIAWRFRPHLWFDEQEKEEYAKPVDVETFLASGRVELCGDEFADEGCDPLPRGKLETDNGYLAVPRDKRVLLELVKRLPGTLYYHVVRAHRRVYVDYWW